MILQSLHDYYLRLQDDPESGIAALGFSPQQISFAIILDQEGNLIQIQDIRDSSAKKPHAIELMAPEGQVRTAGISANFLWDNSGYVLGIDSKGKPERSRATFKSFREKQLEIGGEIKDNGMLAVLKFLKAWKPSQGRKLPNYNEILGSNLVFRLKNEKSYIHDHPKIKKAWIKHNSSQSSKETGMCLVSGNLQPIASLHNKIKGVRNAQTSGAALVSFNLDSFRSFNKVQNYNAPIGEEAAFMYTTALNYLLRFESGQKIQIGDASTVFWTDRPSPIEGIFGKIMDTHGTEAADNKDVADYLRAVRSGKKPVNLEDDSVKFFILGLAPNASRLAVRFWYANTVKALNSNINKHFRALEIIREYDNQAEYPGIWQLLIETVVLRKGVLRKSEDINPLLAGALMRSILTGNSYPIALLSVVLGRIRADHDINYYRAAIIKAVLTRNFKKEVSMALNEEVIDIAYRLGRLFAVLEKAQEEAVPGANATIKDRFFGSASTTPRVVFPQLIRLSQHHLGKLEGGAKVYKEQLIQSILDGVNAPEGFPGFLKLEDQGLFALGYYHQRKAFFTKKHKPDEKSAGK